MDRIALSPSQKAELSVALSGLNSPYDAIEEFLLDIYPVFAGLPREVLRKLFNFRNDPRAYGALLLENFPVDEELPPTPSDGKRSAGKRTFVTEACALGIAQIFGQPIGYYDEKEGEVIHALCPVRSEAGATSSESSEVSLGFHTDFNYDKENPDSPFNVVNPDYVVLVCLKGAQRGDAGTLYADARDIYRHLSPADIDLMRSPQFQFAASFSFTGKCGSERIWSVPAPLLKGPEAFPEISIDLLCGVRALSEEAEGVLSRIRAVCELPGVASKVHLKPGDVFIMDNRKGAHGRTAFAAEFDGNDRWLHRVYVRRSLWEMRRNSNGSLRVF
jgi:L-asparagine oxygenase